MLPISKSAAEFPPTSPFGFAVYCPPKVNWPRANWLPTLLYTSQRYSPPKRSECLPWIQEKLSSPWTILSFRTKGPLVSLPTGLRPRLNVAPPTRGMPQLCGSGVENGSPNSATTLRTPLSSCALLLTSEVYPKRNSFTLVGDKTRALESMYWRD